MSKMNFDLYQTSAQDQDKLTTLVTDGNSEIAGSFIYDHSGLLYLVDASGKANIINFDYFYPVGSVFVTNTSSFPNVSAPGVGTWQSLGNVASFIDANGGATTLCMWKRTE